MPTLKFSGPTADGHPMAVIEQPATETADPGWFTDPLGLHRLRYFDGAGWTEHVTHFGPTPCRGCAHRASSPTGEAPTS